MSPRVKKLIGLFLLLPWILGYALGAIVVADYVPQFWLAKLVYFIVAGLAWTLPVGLSLRWMNSAPKK